MRLKWTARTGVSWKPWLSRQTEETGVSYVLFIYADVQPDLLRAVHAGTDPVDVLQFD